MICTINIHILLYLHPLLQMKGQLFLTPETDIRIINDAKTKKVKGFMFDLMTKGQDMQVKTNRFKVMVSCFSQIHMIDFHQFIAFNIIHKFISYIIPEISIAV